MNFDIVLGVYTTSSLRNFILVRGQLQAQFYMVITSSKTDFLSTVHRTNWKQEVLERTNLPTFLTLFKNVICIKTSVCPNTTLVGNSVAILKHSHIQNNVSNKRIVGSL
jgi:hypothetical protein